MVDIYEQFKDFKSFEVTFYNQNNELQKIYCNIKNVNNSAFIIESTDKIQAKLNDELKLYIYTENGIYSATSKVLEVTQNNKLTEYVIDYPANTKHSQRREYFRADLRVNFDMQITLSDNTSDIHVDKITKNVCGKGMSYISDKPFPEYNSIIINLSFEDKPLQTSAKLVYSKQLIIDNKPKYVHAFTFTDISQKNIDFIVKKCFLHQLEMRKQGKD